MNTTQEPKMCKCDPSKVCTGNCSDCCCERKASCECENHEGYECNKEHNHQSDHSDEGHEHCCEEETQDECNECHCGCSGGCDHKFTKDELELFHFRDIQYALLDYSQFMLLEWKRRAHAITILPEEQKKYFPEKYFVNKLDLFKDCILKNSKFLCSIVFNENYYTNMFGFPTTKRASLSEYDQMSKVESTLHQFVRDWSKEGEEERKLTYTPILERLDKYLPLSEKDQYRILLPGCGLSRLLFEIVRKGYEAQGNEFSYYMLLASNYILNTVTEDNSITIYPWINSPNNCVNTNDIFRPILIPDEAPYTHLGSDVKLSMCAGDFEECYGDQNNEWDSIVTCFFIDTAPNVMNYIDVIYKALKPGGYWINYGPLLYHWQTSEPLPDNLDDPRYGISIELSYEEILMVLEKKGFKILEQSRSSVTYTHNIHSMMATNYNCVLFVAQKPLDI